MEDQCLSHLAIIYAQIAAVKMRHAWANGGFEA